MPFLLYRRQFPVRLAYALKINKSQGQTFKRVGIFIERPIFAHGQLYVALSRWASGKQIKVFVKIGITVPNIVFTTPRQSRFLTCVFATGHSQLPFLLYRRQFPVRLAYALTINKSQGQTFKQVGIFIELCIGQAVG